MFVITYERKQSFSIYTDVKNKIMKKIFFEYKKNIVGYWNVFSFVKEENKLLNLLFLSFNLGREDIVVESDNERVFIQNMLFIDDLGQCPTLELSKKNYDKIIDVWNKNTEKPAQYLILSQNDVGWITLEPKEKLSHDDLFWLEQNKSMLGSFFKNK